MIMFNIFFAKQNKKELNNYKKSKNKINKYYKRSDQESGKLLDFQNKNTDNIMFKKNIISFFNNGKKVKIGNRLIIDFLESDMDYEMMGYFLNNCCIVQDNELIVLNQPNITLKFDKFFNNIESIGSKVETKDHKLLNDSIKYLMKDDAFNEEYSTLHLETKNDILKQINNKPSQGADAYAKYLTKLDYYKRIPSQKVIKFLSDEFSFNSIDICQSSNKLLNRLNTMIQKNLKKQMSDILDGSISGLEKIKNTLLNSIFQLYSNGETGQTLLCVGAPGTGKTNLGVGASKVMAFNELFAHIFTRIDIPGIIKYGPILYHIFYKKLTSKGKNKLINTIKSTKKILEHDLNQFQMSDSIQKVFKLFNENNYELNYTYSDNFTDSKDIITPNNFGVALFLSLVDEIIEYAKDNIEYTPGQNNKADESRVKELYKLYYAVIPMSGSDGSSEYLQGHKPVFVGADAGFIVKSLCSFDYDIDINPLEKLFHKFINDFSNEYLGKIDSDIQILENKSHEQSGDFASNKRLNTRILIGDEVEKSYDKNTGKDASGRWLSILGVPSGFFKDNFLDVRIKNDFLLIFTANGTENLSPPLKDRCLEMRFPAMTLTQKIQHGIKVYNKRCKEMNVDKDLILDESFFKEFIRKSSKNRVGFRAIREDIMNLVKEVALSNIFREFSNSKKSDFIVFNEASKENKKNNKKSSKNQFIFNNNKYEYTKVGKEIKLVVNRNLISKGLSSISNSSSTLYKSSDNSNSKNSFVSEVRGGSYELIHLDINLASRECGAQSNININGPFDFLTGSSEPQIESQKNAVIHQVQSVIDGLNCIKDVCTYYTVFIKFLARVSTSYIDVFVYSVIMGIVSMYFQEQPDNTIVNACGVNINGNLVTINKNNDSFNLVEHIKHLTSFYDHAEKVILPGSLSAAEKQKINNDIANTPELSHLTPIYCNSIREAIGVVFPNLNADMSKNNN